MFVTNWILTTKIQKISEITNFFRHYFLSRTEVGKRRQAGMPLRKFAIRGKQEGIYPTPSLRQRPGIHHHRREQQRRSHPR